MSCLRSFLTIAMCIIFMLILTCSLSATPSLALSVEDPIIHSNGAHYFTEVTATLTDNNAPMSGWIILFWITPSGRGFLSSDLVTTDPQGKARVVYWAAHISGTVTIHAIASVNTNPENQVDVRLSRGSWSITSNSYGIATTESQEAAGSAILKANGMYLPDNGSTIVQSIPIYIESLLVGTIVDGYVRESNNVFCQYTWVGETNNQVNPYPTRLFPNIYYTPLRSTFVYMGSPQWPPAGFIDSYASTNIYPYATHTYHKRLAPGNPILEEGTAGGVQMIYHDAPLMLLGDVFSFPMGDELCVADSSIWLNGTPGARSESKANLNASAMVGL
ncbi:MAG: hypothetical protein IT210_19645 [Armatimonadetes bacterium]|nr:hypothetical protein [Armatimonadota bacterium]